MNSGICSALRAGMAWRVDSRFSGPDPSSIGGVVEIIIAFEG